MDMHEAARLLNCDEDIPGNGDLYRRMAESGLVAIYGLSDDLIEVRGACHAEISALMGNFREDDRQDLRFTSKGLVADYDPDTVPATPTLFRQVDVSFCPPSDFWWTFETDLPHATFVTRSHGEPFSRGIVFSLSDIPGASANDR